MSDLPGSPGGPWSPGSPFDPLAPGGPAGPTRTQVHANTHKYCDDFRICLQSKTISNLYISMDEHCWKMGTIMNKSNVNIKSTTLKIWPLEVTVNVHLSQVKVLYFSLPVLWFPMLHIATDLPTLIEVHLKHVALIKHPNINSVKLT